MALCSTASAAYDSLKSPLECINAIPMTFCDQLGQKLHKLADIYETFYEANKTLQSLRKHEHAGTFPIEIEILREPHFKFSKPFLESEKENPESYFNEIKQLFEVTKVNALAAVIRAKDEEVMFLEQCLRPEEYSPPLLLEIENVYEQEVQRQSRWKNSCSNHNDISDRMRVYSPSLNDDYELARKEVPILATRVIEILRSRDMASLQEALAKSDIHNQDKASTSEATRSLRLLSESIDKSVMEMVKAALAKGKVQGRDQS